MKSQEKALKSNWEFYSEKILEDRPLFSDSELIYNGRKFYDPNNPPFLASVVKVPANLWEKLQLIQAELDKKDNRQTFFHPNYFHITLNEFGWHDQVNIEEITEKLGMITKGISPFDVQIYGINCFERIIFAQVFDVNQHLESIYNKIFNEFPGLERNFPSYIPHISLVKIETTEAREIIDIIKEKFRSVEIGTMHVEEIQLVAARPYLSAGRIETITKIPLN